MYCFCSLEIKSFYFGVNVVAQMISVLLNPTESSGTVFIEVVQRPQHLLQLVPALAGFVCSLVPAGWSHLFTSLETGS